MDRANIRVRTQDLRNDEEYTSVSRLLEHGVECGAVRFERLTGQMKSLINQHRGETVGRLVMASILKGISEHTWTCFTSREYDLSAN